VLADADGRYALSGMKSGCPMSQIRRSRRRKLDFAAKTIDTSDKTFNGRARRDGRTTNGAPQMKRPPWYQGDLFGSTLGYPAWGPVSWHRRPVTKKLASDSGS
jgi:hypothetical protein